MCNLLAILNRKSPALFLGEFKYKQPDVASGYHTDGAGPGEFLAGSGLPMGPSTGALGGGCNQRRPSELKALELPLARPERVTLELLFLLTAKHKDINSEMPFTLTLTLHP